MAELRTNRDRTPAALAARGVVTAYDLQIFLNSQGITPGNNVGIYDAQTQQAFILGWATDERAPAELSVIPSADRTQITIQPKELAELIRESALATEPLQSTPARTDNDNVELAPKKPFFRMGNPWLWGGAVLLAGGGYYAWREGLIPGLGGMDDDGFGAATAAPTGELSTTLGYTLGLLGAGIGLTAFSYGKWGNRIQGGIDPEHLKQVKTNGAIVLAISIAITGGVYLYDRSL